MANLKDEYEKNNTSKMCVKCTTAEPKELKNTTPKEILTPFIMAHYMYF